MTPKCACQVKPVELFTRKRRLTKKVELKVDSKMRPEISPFRLVYGRLPFATLENKFPWPKERPEPVNVFLSCWKIEKKLTGCRVVKDLYPNQLVLVQRKLKKKCEIMVYPTVWNHGLPNSVKPWAEKTYFPFVAFLLPNHQMFHDSPIDWFKIFVTSYYTENPLQFSAEVGIGGQLRIECTQTMFVLVDWQAKIKNSWWCNLTSLPT